MKASCAVRLLACCVFIGGCAVQSRQPTTLEMNQNDVLKLGDSVVMKFWGSSASYTNIFSFKIDPHGAIPLEPVGSIRIAGLTTTQAAKKIYYAWGKSFAQPGVVVTLTKVEVNHSYVLKPGDTISGYFQSSGDGIDQLPVSWRINDHGTANLLIVGAVEIAGLNIDQLAAKIHDTYVPKYFPDLRLVVTKVESP